MDEATDDEIISDLFEWCYSPLTSEAVKTSSVSKPGDSKELIAVAISEDGKYAITREVFYSIELPYDSTIKASLESLTKTEAGEYTAVFNVAGASKFVIYLYSRNSAGSFATAIMNNGVAATNKTYYWANVVDGKATITFTPSSSYYDYCFFSAYNVSETAVESLAEVQMIQLSKSLTVAE